MVSTDSDLLVIGGGPGGSCAAALASLGGMSVRLAGSRKFPRFHKGGSLPPKANAGLGACGAWARVEAGGFVGKLWAGSLPAVWRIQRSPQLVARVNHAPCAGPKPE